MGANHLLLSSCFSTLMFFKDKSIGNPAIGVLDAILFPQTSKFHLCPHFYRLCRNQNTQQSISVRCRPCVRYVTFQWRRKRKAGLVFDMCSFNGGGGGGIGKQGEATWLCWTHRPSWWRWRRDPWLFVSVRKTAYIYPSCIYASFHHLLRVGNEEEITVLCLFAWISRSRFLLLNQRCSSDGTAIKAALILQSYTSSWVQSSDGSKTGNLKHCGSL